MDTWKKHYASPTCNTPQNLAFYYQQNQKVNVRQKEEARNEALDRDGERRPGKRTAASHGQLCIWRIECKIFMLFAYGFQIRRPKRIHKTSKVMEDQKKNQAQILPLDGMQDRMRWETKRTLPKPQSKERARDDENNEDRDYNRTHVGLEITKNRKTKETFKIAKTWTTNMRH